MRLIVTTALAMALSTATAAHAAEGRKSSTAAAPGDSLICKKFTKIGTLAGFYKICKTKSEWDREHSNIRTAGQGGYCGPQETQGGQTTDTC